MEFNINLKYDLKMTQLPGYRYRRYNRLLSHPYINRSRRLRRTDSSPDYLETIIIHTDSSDEERRVDDEIDRLRNRMDELDEEKIRLRREMATKYKERESIRVARRIKKNNIRLKREIETRLLPTIESVAARRQSIVYGIRDLFENIDDHPSSLPPTYESIFQNPTPTATPDRATTSNATNHTDDDNASNASTSSTCSLPSVNSIFESIVNN